MKSSLSNITQSTLSAAKERPLPPSRTITREDARDSSAISKISTGWGKRDKSKSKQKEDVEGNDDSNVKSMTTTTIIEKDMWIFDGQASRLFFFFFIIWEGKKECMFRRAA
jgi:hypothetical protein